MTTRTGKDDCILARPFDSREADSYVPRAGTMNSSRLQQQTPNVLGSFPADVGLERINQALIRAGNPSTRQPQGLVPKHTRSQGTQVHTHAEPPLSQSFSTHAPLASLPLVRDKRTRPDRSAQGEHETNHVSDAGLQGFVHEVRKGYQRPTRSNKNRDRQLSDSAFENSITKLSLPSDATRPYDVNAIRRDFPILHQQVRGHQLVWFDNAATTQKPQSVIDAVSSFYAHDNSNIHRAAHSLAARSTDAFESARRKVQHFIGAGSAKEIVWVRGTTEGINFVSQTFGRKFLQPHDEIVLSTLEHHANIVPWQLISREMGARLRVIPVNDAGEVMLAQYEALLGPRTKIVALTQASNSLGTILPVAEMTRMAHRHGARVLVDGAQSIAHFPVNVRELECDFFVFSGHKIFAPMGVGVVYMQEELLDLLPPWQGGGNMIRDVSFEETMFADPPARFEAGTPTVADAVGLGAALDYVSRLGMENVARHEHELLTYATDRLSRIAGLKMIGNAREKVSVISFVLKGRSTEEVGKALDQHGIAVRAGHHCAQPSLRRFGVETTVRPSFSIYNTFEEIDRLEDAIRRIRQR